MNPKNEKSAAANRLAWLENHHVTLILRQWDKESRTYYEVEVDSIYRDTLTAGTHFLKFEIEGKAVLIEPERILQITDQGL